MDVSSRSPFAPAIGGAPRPPQLEHVQVLGTVVVHERGWGFEYPDGTGRCIAFEFSDAAALYSDGLSVDGLEERFPAAAFVIVTPRGVM